MKALERYATNAEEIQMDVMQQLVSKAAFTQWGKKYNFAHIHTYEEFAANQGINTYEELKSYIQRMREGEEDVLWPGQVRFFAKSSGTTNDKSKFIPVSHDGLRKIHYQGARDSIACYLEQNPSSRMFKGKSLILGGSHSPNLNTPNSIVGDLSAILIENVPKPVNISRIPSKEIALLSDFEEKRDRIARVAMNENVTSTRCGLTWKCSTTGAYRSCLTAINIKRLSRIRTCTTRKPTTPQKASSAFRTTSTTQTCS